MRAASLRAFFLCEVDENGERQNVFEAAFPVALLCNARSLWNEYELLVASRTLLRRRRAFERSTRSREACSPSLSPRPMLLSARPVTAVQCNDLLTPLAPAQTLPLPLLSRPKSHQLNDPDAPSRQCWTRRWSQYSQERSGRVRGSGGRRARLPRRSGDQFETLESGVELEGAPVRTPSLLLRERTSS